METQTQQSIAGIKSIKVHEYKIDLSINIKGQPVARLLKFLSAGKNKGTYKLIEGYYFANEDRRKNWISEKIKGINSTHKLVQNRKDLKSDIRKNMKHDFKAGDVYYNSWGYDQTNIDFYLIVEVKEKSVIIQRIGEQVVERSEGFMCASVMPDIDCKIGKPETKIIQFYLSNDNKPIYYIKSSYGSISKYEKGEKGVYKSWHA